MRLVPCVLGCTPAYHHLYLFEHRSFDDGGLNEVRRPHPFVGFVPPQLGQVAKGDVFNVDQDLVFTLLDPHLMARLAGVDEDRADRELAPCNPAAMAVTDAVVR